MRRLTELLDFWNNQMSMTDIYQPAIILHLLGHNGSASKTELARVLSGHDRSIEAYYGKIVMRWPKITLTKHNIVSYERRGQRFQLNFALDDQDLIEQARRLCDEKIQEWIDRHPIRDDISRYDASQRYRVLKAARGKCELCGISAKVCPIDIDHIIPQSKADKQGYVLKDNVRIHVDDERNLQALCYRCNRAKRDLDDTDFRQPRSKLVRERSVEYVINPSQSGSIRRLEGKELEERLYERLQDEHARLIDDTSNEPLGERIADMVEVLLAIAHHANLTAQELAQLIRAKRAAEGCYTAGTFFEDVA
jgi:predicted house-cleaning noncanonical NTP pyrophosphatase (MazG superfamily)